MMLLTKEIRKQLPPLYTNDEKEAKDVQVIVKFFHPASEWTWYATEFDGTDRFFGYCVGPCPDLGYFSLAELESVKVRGLGVERDLYFKQCSLADVMAKHP